MLDHSLLSRIVKRFQRCVWGLILGRQCHSARVKSCHTFSTCETMFLPEIQNLASYFHHALKILASNASVLPLMLLTKKQVKIRNWESKGKAIFLSAERRDVLTTGEIFITDLIPDSRRSSITITLVFVIGCSKCRCLLSKTSRGALCITNLLVFSMVLSDTKSYHELSALIEAQPVFLLFACVLSTLEGLHSSW